MTKLCPYCAEEIQAAAIVCKHCRRDLVTPPPARRSRGRWIALGAGLLLGLPLLVLYCGEDHQRYLAFSAQREAWHRKCDAYIASPEGNAGARACAEELQALTAYAARQGWTR